MRGGHIVINRPRREIAILPEKCARLGKKSLIGFCFIPPKPSRKIRRIREQGGCHEDEEAEHDSSRQGCDSRTG